MWKADRKGFTSTGMDQKMIKFFMKLLEHPMKEVNDPNLTKVNIINVLKIMEKVDEDAASQAPEARPLREPQRGCRPVYREE